MSHDLKMLRSDLVGMIGAIPQQTESLAVWRDGQWVPIDLVALRAVAAWAIDADEALRLLAYGDGSKQAGEWDLRDLWCVGEACDRAVEALERRPWEPA